MLGKSVKPVLLILVLFLVLVIPSVFAQETTDTNTDTVNTTTEEQVDSTPTESVETTLAPSRKPINPLQIKKRISEAKARNQEIKETMRQRASEAAQKRQEKLSEARLKLCKAREQVISNRIKSMYQRASAIDKAHEKIYNLVDKFYTEKLVPNGYTLTNYNDLKSAVSTNKENVKTLLESTKASAEEFDCDSEDPKSQADAFREDMKALIAANKEYKDSIRDFVQAVRDLAKTARLDKISGTPTPTVAEGGSE